VSILIRKKQLDSPCPSGVTSDDDQKKEDGEDEEDHTGRNKNNYVIQGD